MIKPSLAILLMITLSACSLNAKIESKPSESPRLKLLKSLAKFNDDAQSPLLIASDCRTYQVGYSEPTSTYFILFNSGGPEYTFDLSGNLTAVREFETRSFSDAPNRKPELKDEGQADQCLYDAMTAIFEGHYYRSIVGNDDARIKAMKDCKESK